MNKSFVFYRCDYIKILELSFLLAILPIFTGTGLAQAEIVISEIHAIDLETLPGGSTSTASDINDAGNIAGSSDTLSGETHAFFLSGGVMSDIGTLSGGDTSHANGINDLNQVVGRANILNGITGEKVLHGFEWQQGGVIRDLGAYPPEDDLNSTSNAHAINNSGLIAGSVDLAGVVWDLAGTANFPPFPPYVRVTDPGPFTPAITFDINTAWQAAGSLLSATTGFRWQAGVLETLLPLQAFDDDAFGINDLGEAVGRGLLAPPARYHATYWPNPVTVQDLGTLGGDNSEAHDINNDRIIVGYSETATGDTVAFIWHADFDMQSLGTLGGANSKAFGINSAGQIVGESETATGHTHATLWSVVLATRIMIDIKPGSDPNCFNINGHGVIPVALLGAEDFDVTAIDLASLSFAGLLVRKRGNKGPQCSLDYSNDDTYLDLICHFEDDPGTWEGGVDEATLTGHLLDGTLVEGTDSICLVP